MNSEDLSCSLNSLLCSEINGSVIFSSDNSSSMSLENINDYFNLLHSVDGYYFEGLINLCKQYGENVISGFNCSEYFESIKMDNIMRPYQYCSSFQLKLLYGHDDSLFRYHLGLHITALTFESVYSVDKQQIHDHIIYYQSEVICKDLHPALRRQNKNILLSFANEINRLCKITQSLFNCCQTWNYIDSQSVEAYHSLRQTVYCNSQFKCIPLEFDDVYHSYSSGQLLQTDGETVRKDYEKYGDVAVSLVAQLKSFTAEEQKNITILQTLINDNKLDIKKKIVNMANTTSYNEVVNEKDDKRKAFSYAFNSVSNNDNANAANYLIKSLWRRNAIDTGIADPKSNPHNGEGVWGVDLLNKDYECGLQLKHFDFPQYLDKPYAYRSFRDTMSTEAKALAYNPATDGAFSIFINPNGFPDYLVRGDGSFIVIPPYSMVFVRGDVLHFGSGNRSQFKGIYKIFFYGDPPFYDRKDPELQYKVFLPRHHEFNTVIRDKKNGSIAKMVIIPEYPCLYCGIFRRYTFPYCKDCLLSHLNFSICCTSLKNIFFVKYMGVEVPPGYVFSELVTGDIVSSGSYHKTHPDLFGSIIFAVACCDKDERPLDWYLDCFYKRSFISCIKRSAVTNLSNVFLRMNTKTKEVFLVTSKRLVFGSELVLFNKTNCYENDLFISDTDENQILELGM